MYNKVLMIGRLGCKPALKESNGSNKYTQFPIAINSKRGDSEVTQWFDIACFGKTAEACANYLDKGSLVNIEGSLQSDNYEKDGKKYNKVSIIADRVLFLSPKNGFSQGAAQSQEQQQDAFGGGDIADDIPF